MKFGPTELLRCQLPDSAETPFVAANTAWPLKPVHHDGHLAKDALLGFAVPLNLVPSFHLIEKQPPADLHLLYLLLPVTEFLKKQSEEAHQRAAARCCVTVNRCGGRARRCPSLGSPY